MEDQSDAQPEDGYQLPETAVANKQGNKITDGEGYLIPFINQVIWGYNNNNDI